MSGTSAHRSHRTTTRGAGTRAGSLPRSGDRRGDGINPVAPVRSTAGSAAVIELGEAGEGESVKPADESAERLHIAGVSEGL